MSEDGTLAVPCGADEVKRKRSVSEEAVTRMTQAFSPRQPTRDHPRR